MVGMLSGSLLMLRFDVEEKIPQITADLTARRKEEVEARGEVYISSEEKAAIEQAENDRIAEENCVRELKQKCAKKGLKFLTFQIQAFEMQKNRAIARLFAQISFWLS